MTKPGLSLIIIHWNTPELLEQQLSEFKNYTDIEVIVVDNHSQFDMQSLKRKFSFCTWILNAHDVGFSRAANQGFIASTSEWVLFLNPDVSPTSAQLLQMVQYATDEKLDALSPLSTSSNYQKPLPSVASLLTEFTPLGKLVPLQLFSSITLVGGCFLIKQSALKKLGGWDERFWLWFEDSDLTQTLLDEGFKIDIAPVHVKHLGGTAVNTLSDQVKRQLFFHAMLVYAQEHFTAFGFWIVSQIKRKYSRSQLLPSIKTGITLVIPNMKASLLFTFLESNEKRLLDYTEIIVVSSDLTSDTLWELRKKYPNVRFISIQKNEGFSTTVNIGFRTATTTWVATCNDDVVLPTIHWSDVMAELPPRTGSFNPIIVNPPQRTIETAGIRILSKGQAEPVVSSPANQIIQTDATNGAFVVYSSEALTKIGLFDEKFGSYLEDIDLSLRLKRNGYKNIVIRDIVVEHLKHQTSGDWGKYKNWLDVKNWWLVILKNWSLSELFFNLPAILLERLRNIKGLLF